MSNTLALTHSLISDCDHHLGAVACELRRPHGAALQAELRARADGLLDYRLVLMAARRALTAPATCSRPPAPRS